MTPSAINTLFGAQANPASAKPSQSNAPGAQPFGAVLAREMEGRPESVRAEAPRPNSRDGQDSRANKTSQQTRNANADAASARARQEQQRLQDRKSANEAARPADTAPRSESPETQKAATAALPESGPKKTAADAEANADTDTEDVPPGTATADLLALVNSMLQRPGVPAEAAAAGATGDDAAQVAATLTAPTALTGKQALTGEPGADGSGADGAADAAFEALLTHAAQTNHASQAGQARDGASGRNMAALSAEGGDPRAAVASTAQPLLATAGSATAALGRAELVGNAASLLTNAPVQNEPVPLAGTSSANATIATSVAQATGLPGSERLAPQVGTSAWDQALGQRVVWMAAGAQQSASLMLNPPDLGPLQVVINVNNAQAEATFTAAQPEVRQALEAALPKLKEMLAEAGISLGQASVNAGTSGQQGSGERQQAGAGPGVGAADKTAGTVSETVITGRARTLTSGNGLVDTFA